MKTKNMENAQISTEPEKYRTKLETYLYLVIEYGLYLYIFMFWFDKGEGLRSIGLYSSLTGFLILMIHAKDIKISFNIITLSFLAYLFSILLSTFFSIDPYYSLAALKHDVLKAVIIYFIVSTIFDNNMLLRMVKVISLSGLFFLALGFYDFVLGDAEFYLSQNVVLSGDKNKYGFPLGIFLSFFLLFSILSKLKWEKLIWRLAGAWAMIAAVFSASRGAVGSVFTVAAIFAFSVFNKRQLKITFIGVLIVLSSTIALFGFLPETTKFAFSSIPEHMLTFNERTYLFWEPAMEAVRKKPVIGWGYGKMIYRNPESFENSKKPDWEKKGGLHSTFVNILFHQGIVGLSLYMLLLLLTAYVLLQMFRHEIDERKILAISLFSIIVASFFVSSFVKQVPFRSLAIVLGISAALYNNRSAATN